MVRRFEARGVIPAVLLPFGKDLSIDEAAFRAHLRDVVAVRGVTAIAVNGHSTEVSSCDVREQERVLEIALDEVGTKVPVISGIFTDSTLAARRMARSFAERGASAFLVFPPRLLMEGGMHRREMIIDFSRNIAEAADLPQILFQFPLANGMGTPLDTLVKMVEEVPSFCAIKDFSNNPVVAETNLRKLRELPRRINVLTSHSSWLLGSLVLGCDGILSGAGSTIADLHVALLEAVNDGDLKRARSVADRLFPLNGAFYADPFLDMHNRMKAALVMLGRLPAAHVRPPLLPLPEAERARIRAALEAAALLPPARQTAA